MQVTAADRLSALWHVFGEPQFGVTLGAIVVMLVAAGRVRAAGARAGSAVARLGLFLHWLGLGATAVLFGIGCVVLANSVPLGDSTVAVVVLWWGAAASTWVLGKGARFVLTGPMPAPPLPAVPPTLRYPVPKRAQGPRASVPPAGGRQ